MNEQRKNNDNGKGPNLSGLKRVDAEASVTATANLGMCKMLPARQLPSRDAQIVSRS